MHDKQFEAIASSSDSTAPKKEGNSNQNPKKPSPEDIELVSLFTDFEHYRGIGYSRQTRYSRTGIQHHTARQLQENNSRPAFTVHFMPASNPSGSIGDFINNIAVRDSIIINNSSHTDCIIWGNIITQYAGLQGLTGTVITSIYHDINYALSNNYPVFTAGR